MGITTLINMGDNVHEQMFHDYLIADYGAIGTDGHPLCII